MNNLFCANLLSYIYLLVMAWEDDCKFSIDLASARDLDLEENLKQFLGLKSFRLQASEYMFWWL